MRSLPFTHLHVYPLSSDSRGVVNAARGSNGCAVRSHTEPPMTSQPTVQPEQNKGKGKHVSTACSGCRRRKIKCDGITPRCSNCVLYNQECVFQYGVDKRKIAPKERLQALTAYCHELESLLSTHGIPLPTPPPLHVQKDGLSQLIPTPAVNAGFITSQTVPPAWSSVEAQGKFFPH